MVKASQGGDPSTNTLSIDSDKPYNHVNKGR